MKRTLVLSAALTLGVLLFGLTPASNATAVLTLTDGTTTVTVTDNVAGDFNPAAGFVTYIGAVGNFIVNVTTGHSSSPSDGVQIMDLNSVDTSTGAGGTLTMSFSDIGFTTDAPTMVMDIGGTLAPGATISYSSCFDTANTLFTCGGGSGSLSFAYPPAAFSGTKSYAGPGTTNPYSVTETVVLYHPAGSLGSSFNAQLTTVPEPGSLALLGSGLIGLAGFARRKFGKS